MDVPSFPHLDLEVEGSVARLTLARPEVLNALSLELLRSLPAACAWLATRDEVRVVVLAGAGGSFCAGADLGMLDALLDDAPAARAAAAAGDEAATALESLDAVTVAQLEGRCVGGGVVLALACDLRLASETAQLSVPELELGIPLAWGGIPRLLREVPPAIARDLVLTCRTIGAEEALRAGLVSQVHPADRLAGVVTTLAAELAGRPRLPVRATLDAVRAELSVGAPRGWSDADTLLSAVRDPESRAAGQAYLERVLGRG
ncbi:MAG: enoyl-CoA hydratase/isomerase family protein [Nitriliruptoraceae bacterium]